MPREKTTTKKRATKKQTKGAPVQVIEPGTVQDLISFDDAAQMLGVSRRTIERLVDREQLHTYKKKFGTGRGRLPRLLDRAEVQAISAEVVSAEQVSKE